VSQNERLATKQQTAAKTNIKRAVDKNVLGFQVAVQHTRRVKIFKAAQNLICYEARVRVCQWRFKKKHHRNQNQNNNAPVNSKEALEINDDRSQSWSKEK
jgi:hypothetical protein